MRLNNSSKTALSQRPDNPSLSNDDVGFGVYVHWPFCAAKCPYCDFNSHVRQGAQRVDEKSFLEAYQAEIRYFSRLAPERLVSTIFFGGGTPSLMSPELVGAVLEEIRANWPVRENAEITFEANPSSVEADRFAGYAAAGVNRVSLGVQSLIDEDLARLGRLHSAAEARAALQVANRYFDRVSFDMIYARPGQNVDGWRAELSDALSLAGGHLSLYQLTIEPQTPFQQLYDLGKLVIPDEDVAHDLYQVTQEVCGEHGLHAYEVSNHARVGEQSQHNLIYWRYGDYAGVGPGAHSRVTFEGERLALSTVRHPENWRDAALSHGHGIETRESIGLRAQAEEMLLMGLRLSEGVDLSRLNRLTGHVFDREKLATLEGQGLLHVDDDGLAVRASADGRLVLNGLIAEVVSTLQAP